ncbi:hypothetical protein SSS_05417 [Sarcoptes scabiei]|nr:hypothetical protein SSS_05417 [Sarcoptes scabiei]
MPVRYSFNIPGFVQPMLHNLDDCDCICEEDECCCYDKIIDESDPKKKNVVDMYQIINNKSASINLDDDKPKIKPTLFCPPPLINSQQLGIAHSLLYSGSKFGGYQKSKGNSYDVEVVFQVIFDNRMIFKNLNPKDLIE